VGAGLVFAGQDKQTSEEFNGTAWAAGGGLSAIKRYSPGSAGVQTAALCVGGYEGSANVNKTELYNGVSWSLSGVINTARRNLGAAGTIAAAVSFGGFTTAATNVTEEFDGAVWTAVNNMVTSVQSIPGCGTQTAALTCGGNNAIVETEEYNGTNWSLTGNLNVARFGSALVGLQDAAMVAAGTGTGSSYLTSTEKYNGSAWTTGLNMNIPSQINHTGGIGSPSNMIVAGGYRYIVTGPYEGIEIYTGAVPVIIDGAIFDSYSSTVIVQVFLPPFESAASATAGVFLGRYIDLEPVPFVSQDEFLASMVVFAPFDAGVTPLASVSSMLAELHVTAIIRATFPALTAALELNVRSGFIRENLPALTMAATGQIGSVGRIQTNLPALIIGASGLTGNVGSISKSLPRFTITVGLLSENRGTLAVTLPALYIDMRGDVTPAEVVFKVMAMNLKHFAATEYAAFNFNSFAELNGILLGAKSDGIYPLVGGSDKGQPIPANLSTGQGLIEFFRLRDIYINSSTGGQRRAKMPRGTKPGYVKIDVENINGGELDIDSIQVYAEPVKRKKQ
jgi:hypothetical protein